MTVDAPHTTERRALCALFDERGPDASTLCEGWQAKDLATHLYLREHRPVAALGIVAGGPLGRLTDRAMAGLESRIPFHELVDRLRSGPPVWWRPIDALANTGEYFIHHEDLRRGAGDTTPRPEAEIERVEAALYDVLRRTARLFTRALGPTPLQLAAPGRPVISARKGPGEPVVLGGRPGELALYLNGRKKAAHVTIEGPAAGCKVLEEARLGL